jgi:hypothetical protein
LTSKCTWDAASAFANCGHGVAYVQGSGSDIGTSKPMTFAAFKLITRSKFAGLPKSSEF